MNQRRIAIYVRLSNDDKNSGSTSLETQEKIIREKISLLPEYDGEEPLVFRDNGYSGRNLDRPSITTLLNMVKQSEISCIIIKDFSRLSRDMLQVGYLVESVFPLFQTRFISVNDSYDSADFYEDTGGINVTFKYLLAEYYSRDLSRKIKAGKQSRIKRGEHVQKNPLFGYTLDSSRRFAIDEKAADTIRYMFKLASEGNSVVEIRKNLYENKIPTRSEYKRYVLGYEYAQLPRIQGAWEHSSIMAVLRNEQYIGTYIGGRKVAKNDGTRSCVKQPESQWVKIPDHHPAIIDKETFANVQELFPRRKYSFNVRHHYPLKSKVFCGCCGHTLSRVGNVTMKFNCIMGRDLPDFACNHLSILEQDLLEQILQTLKIQSKKILKLSMDDALEDEPRATETFVGRKRQLYEAVTKQYISHEEYLLRKATLEDEIQQATYLHSKKDETMLADKTARSAWDEATRLAKLVKKTKCLTEELTTIIIEKVLIFPDNSIKVEFCQNISEYFNMD